VKVTIGSTVVSSTEQWETDELAEISCVQRAWQGEVGQGTMLVPDSAGTFEIYAGQRVKLEDGPTTFLDGFAGAVTTVRGNRIRPARIHRVVWIDRNALLDGFRTNYPRWARPEEAARARILALNTAYLGSLDTTYVVNTGAVMLPAKSYVTDDLVQEVLADINAYINKTIFIVGNELHFHWPTEGEVSMFVIDDTVGETQAITGTTRAAAEEVAQRAGTYTGSPVAGQTGPTQESTAVLFDGTDDYVSVPDQAALDLGDVLTLEIWAKRSASGAGTFVLLDKGTNAYQLDFAADFLRFTKSGVGAIVSSTTTVTDANWHHLVVTKTGATVKLYIDSVDRTGGITNQTLADNAVALNIGRFNAASNYFAGTLGMAAVYNAALTAADVLDHYEKALGLRLGSYKAAVLAHASCKGFWTLGDRYRLMPTEPTREKDPLDLRNDVRGINRAGLAYTITDAASIARHNAAGLRHQALIVQDTASGYIGAARRALSEGKWERATFSVKLQGIAPAQAAFLKPGQLISITSQLMGLIDRGTRIAQLTWNPQPSGLYDADLELEYPRRRVSRR
jgi:concanavalin A-like lectin/glucanase superfamily protein